MENKMTYTSAQIRAAIYRAAARIERNPNSYNFGRFNVPTDEGGCGCMWGWIGYELGMFGAGNEKVAYAIGEVLLPGDKSPTARLYQHVFDIDSARGAANDMRSFADAYYKSAEPASRPFDKAYAAFKRALAQDADSAGTSPTPASVTP